MHRVGITLRLLSVGKILLTQLVLIGPHKNCVISSLVYFPNKSESTTPLLYSLAILIRCSYPSSFLMCRTINTHISCFDSSRTIVLREEYVSLSDGPNDVTVRRPYGFLLYIQLCCCLLFYLSFLRDVREYGGL